MRAGFKCGRTPFGIQTIIMLEKACSPAGSTRSWSRHWWIARPYVSEQARGAAMPLGMVQLESLMRS